MLSKIIKSKKEEVEYLRRKTPVSDLKYRIRDMEETRGFLKAISPSPHPSPTRGEGEKVARQLETRIIAEVKKASPSKGIIREDFNPLKIAEIYQENGASAISVLTDKEFFQGDINYLSDIKKIVTLPLLRKDFIISEYQVFESRVYGADAFLLIAAILGKNQLEDYMHLGVELGMTPLIEVHTKRELNDVLSIKADLIGINNRDLDTFKVDIRTTEKLIEYIPEDITVVSESGIEKRDDILHLKEIGVDVFLIGEFLMKEKDIGKKLKELIGISSKE
ncbi:MAG: indole-3-glycerol phosphate synthase TrpC [Nitrospinae bacterium]|nr:indole-3-glycerol phosphate synthase TrpC [Nitrospinota bacterium]